MDKETLKVLANKLMFTMEENEYDTLSEEFDTILKQMSLIENIEGIEDILKNSGSTLYNQVKIPKVVE